MDIAILLFDRLTALDAVGPYEVLSRLPDAKVTFVATEAGPKRTDTDALALVADATLADVPRPDILLVPGGPGQVEAEKDGLKIEVDRLNQHFDKWKEIVKGKVIQVSLSFISNIKVSLICNVLSRHFPQMLSTLLPSSLGEYLSLFLESSLQ